MKHIYCFAVVALAYLSYVHAGCVQCNSNTEAICATNPLSFMAKDCVNSTSKCYTRVLNGNTIRGCASDLDSTTAENCNNELECLICTYMEGCNRNIFPVHRAQCLQCSGDSVNSTCARNIYATATVCPQYKLGDRCFIRNLGRNSTGSFQRGCLSSAQASKVCVKEENCFICEGVGCNYLHPNDTQIPLAHDNAATFHTSLGLFLISFIITRFP